MADSVARTLAQHGLESTPQGRIAMKLALRLDNSDETDTGAAVAALAGRLIDVLDRIGARPQSSEPDPIDRLQARHRARFAAGRDDLAG